MTSLNSFGNKALIIAGAVCTLLGIFAALLIGTTTLVSCKRYETEQVDCVTQLLWFGFVPLANANRYPNVDAVEIVERCTGLVCGAFIRIDHADSQRVALPLVNLSTAERAERVLSLFLRDASSSTVAINLSRPIFNLLGFALLVLPLLIVGAVFLYSGAAGMRSGEAR